MRIFRLYRILQYQNTRGFKSDIQKQNTETRPVSPQSPWPIPLSVQNLWVSAEYWLLTAVCSCGFSVGCHSLQSRFCAIFRLYISLPPPNFVVIFGAYRLDCIPTSHITIMVIVLKKAWAQKYENQHRITQLIHYGPTGVTVAGISVMRYRFGKTTKACSKVPFSYMGFTLNWWQWDT